MATRMIIVKLYLEGGHEIELKSKKMNFENEYLEHIKSLKNSHDFTFDYWIKNTDLFHRTHIVQLREGSIIAVTITFE